MTSLPISRTFRIMAFILSGCVLTSAASAQERLPFREGPGFGSLSDARYIKPGALLFATFDANKDFVITSDEIEAGARLAFAGADANGDGFMSPLEQRSWAGRIGSETDVLANPTTFPSALPGQVTEDEFVFGLQTFAQRFIEPEDPDRRILVRNFTFAADEARRESDRIEDDIDRLRRPVISDRRQADGTR